MRQALQQLCDLHVDGCVWVPWADIDDNVCAQMGYKDLRSKHEPRVANLYGFSSAKKMASVLVRTDEGYRLYNKVSHEMQLLQPCGVAPAITSLCILSVHPSCAADAFELLSCRVLPSWCCRMRRAC